MTRTQFGRVRLQTAFNDLVRAAFKLRLVAGSFDGRVEIFRLGWIGGHSYSVASRKSETKNYQAPIVAFRSAKVCVFFRGAFS